VARHYVRADCAGTDAHCLVLKRKKFQKPSPDKISTARFPQVEALHGPYAHKFFNVTNISSFGMSASLL
jgi:hypothetical protein